MITKKLAIRIGLVLVALLLLSGCNGSFAGKGHLVGKEGGTASLSFRVLCPFGSDTIHGKVVYFDHAAKVRIRGNATGVLDGQTCDGDTGEAHYAGSYTSNYGSGGLFEMELFRNAIGCDGGDQITIRATSGVHAGYENTSCFSGRVRPLRAGSVPAIG